MLPRYVLITVAVLLLTTLLSSVKSDISLTVYPPGTAGETTTIYQEGASVDLTAGSNITVRRPTGDSEDNSYSNNTALRYPANKYAQVSKYPMYNFHHWVNGVRQSLSASHK